MELNGSILIKERMRTIAIVYLNKALEIDNSKILCASKIGYIYNLLKKYDEAIPYLEIYINSVQNKEKSEERVVLFNQGYAFYYNKNYERAEYYFKESLKLGVIDNETNKLINKYLINIWKKLQGKIVRQIRHIKFSIKKSSKLKSKNKKVRSIKKEGDVRRKIFFALLIFFILKAVFGIYRDNKVPGQSDYIKAQQEIIAANSGTISLYLKDIIPIDFYAYIFEDGNIGIYNESYINEHNLKNNVYSKVYIGNINGKNIMFTDKNFSLKLLDKDGEYTVSGNMRKINSAEPINIPNLKGNNETIITHCIYTPDKYECPPSLSIPIK